MGRKVDLIACLCWDDPYIDDHKDDITEYIIKAEQRRGNDTTGAIIVVEKAFDPDMGIFAEKKSYVWERLRAIYDEYYDESRLSDLIHSYTVPREVRMKDGHTLTKYYVLYADRSAESEEFW